MLPRLRQLNNEKDMNEPNDDGLGSVSYWLNELSNGQRSEAARELCERYFGRLIALARSRLPSNARQVADEEDVALSAVQSFFRRAEKGEFPNVTDRDSLWALLAQITVFKALRNIRRERTQKRGGNNVVRESELEATEADFATLEAMIAEEPTPEIVASMNEQATKLLEALSDDLLRSIAVKKLDGYGNREISDALGVGLRTVERKLAIIRSTWVDRVE